MSVAAYYKGREAFSKGLSLEDNPYNEYDRASFDFADWVEGWYEGYYNHGAWETENSR